MVGLQFRSWSQLCRHCTTATFHNFWTAAFAPPTILDCGRQPLRYCQPAKDCELRAPPRQLCNCEQSQRQISQRLVDSARPQLFKCRMPTIFGLHSHPRPITKLKRQSSVHRTDCAIASAPKLLRCRASKPPRVRYCAARDLFAIKRRFRSKDLS